MDITQQHLQDSHVIPLNRNRTQERLINASSSGGSDELLIFSDFPPTSGEMVAQLVFGGCDSEQDARARMAGAAWPVLWVQGDVCSRTHLSGTQAFLTDACCSCCSCTTHLSSTQAFIIDGQPIHRVTLADRVVGSLWADEDADYCLLAGILPTNARDTRGSQTISCMQQMEAALHKAGMDFSHLVRTWFYLDDLLAWYDEFNAARTKFFENRNVFKGLVPASTGIGARNPAGAALAAGALAIRPRHGRVRIDEVESPLQCPATQYRSSFSRAVEVAFPDRRMLIISGTASIAADGRSMFTNDVAKQIHLTLDVVEAILRSREMDWKNTTRAVGYFRDIGALPVFEACCRERGISPLPMAPAHATVCRDDLLFEIELDAVSTSGLKREKGVTGDAAYGI
jgi:enamine deaminase RidA (YjgF/YER057c/UK114 family)